MSESHLKGATALVTGSSSGIGRSIAVRLGAAGAKVYVCGRSQDGLAETAASVESAGGQCVSQALDKRLGRDQAGYDPNERTPLIGVPDDIAIAVFYALTQPPEISVREIVISPSKDGTSAI
jgi:NADP-dependent 3-hydroxy acid dehydrogenase YdfG